MVQPRWKTVWQFLKILKIELPYDPAMPVIPKRTEKTDSSETYAKMCIAVLFAIAKCPSTDGG